MRCAVYALDAVAMVNRRRSVVPPSTRGANGQWNAAPASKVNRATAKDLEAALDVPTSVAEAIVASRLEKGEFKTVDDLKKVPGLESSKIEAQKGRIIF